MAIENRNLEAGTRLVGRHKGKATVCLVEAGEEGKVVFKLEGKDKTFKSLSSAATEITKGPINGWKFWTVEGEETAKPERASARKPSEKKPAPKAKARSRSKPAHRIIRQHENQEDVPEGQARYWCDGCMESFLAFEEPTQCPNGHRIDDPALNATTAATKGEAE